MSRADYPFIALMMCAVLGWGLQQVMGLTWPQFEYISLRLDRLQYQRAKNEVFFGVCGALGGQGNRDNLMRSAGTFLTSDEGPFGPRMAYTQAELDAAMKRANEIAQQQGKKE